MIEVGHTYYYLGDDSFILYIISVGEYVNFKYLSPSELASDDIRQWTTRDFLDDHAPVTKLHKLLKGIE